MIILLRLSVFGAPAIVDVSPTHYLRRLLGHDLILVWEVHVRLRLVFHFVLAQDRIVHIMFDDLSFKWYNFSGVWPAAPESVCILREQ